MRDRNGAEVWLVAVKCTFDIQQDGSLCASTEQLPVLRIPEYIGEPGKSSLRYEDDLIATKITTDILLLGHAYAPHGQPAVQTDVGLRVGNLVKVLRVFGDRYWREDFSISSPRPFSKMPIVYERAFGGIDRSSAQPERDWDWRNPVGTGFVMSKPNAIGLRLPNIEYLDHPIQVWSDRPQPAGFRPLCSHWQQRAVFAGTYDVEWERTRQPLLPEDFDDRFFQCAPADQQTERFLLGGEPVVLKNLTSSSYLAFRLPRLIFGFETRFYSGRPEIHHAKLHTVILEPDFPRVSLVFHTALPCHARAQKLDRTIVIQKQLLHAAESSLEVEEEIVSEP